MKEQQEELSQYVKMTETPIPRLILTLSVPSIISMLINNIYNLVDTAFVGQLGTSASGAVGIVFGFMAIIQAFGFMLAGRYRDVSGKHGYDRAVCKDLHLLYIDRRAVHER